MQFTALADARGTDDITISQQHSRVRFSLYVKLSRSNSTSHIRTFLSYSTGGLYTQSGDNRYSQDNSTETEI